MSDINFQFNGINEFEEKLNKIHKEFPDAEEKILKKTGNELKKSSKDKTPYMDHGKRHIRDEYKLSKPQFNGENMQITMTNTAPHFHLIEKGHRKISPHTGKELGFVPGIHMVKRSMEELETDFPKKLDKMLDKILKK